MSKKKLYLLHLKNIPILQQLQIEEALLRTDTRNFCLFNEGSKPTIVMGISGKEEELIYMEQLKQSKIPLIRRFTGGGTVVVDEQTLFVTLICNQEAVNIPCFPKHILHWNGNLYKHALRSFDFQIQENDYAIGEKKFGGNAQYIAKERWLHHSTLLYNYDKERMNLLKIPKHIPAYRENRNHNDFLCKLEDVVKDRPSFFQDVQKTLSEHFHINKIDFEEVEMCLKKPHRTSTSLIRY